VLALKERSANQSGSQCSLRPRSRVHAGDAHIMVLEMGVVPNLVALATHGSEGWRPDPGFEGIVQLLVRGVVLVGGWGPWERGRICS
jgi:hypothetical protein